MDLLIQKGLRVAFYNETEAGKCRNFAVIVRPFSFSFFEVNFHRPIFLFFWYASHFGSKFRGSIQVNSLPWMRSIRSRH